MGLKQTVKTGLKKTGKLIVKETIIDPAMFLKNIGKVSKNVLLRPKKSFMALWKAGKEGVENLKTLRETLREKLLKKGKDVCGLKRSIVEDTPNMNNTFDSNLEKRGKGACAVDKPSPEDLLKAKSDLSQLGDESFVTEHLDFAANKYRSMSDAEDFEKWKKYLNTVSTKTDQEELQVYAVYKYTEHSDVNEYTMGLVQGVKDVKKKVKKQAKEEMDKAVQQSIVVQDYLKTHKTAVTNMKGKSAIKSSIFGFEYGWLKLLISMKLSKQFF